MKIIKSVFLVVTITLALLIFVFEIYLKFNKTIFYKLNEYLPNTSLTEKIRKEIEDINLNKKTRFVFSGKEYYLYTEPTQAFYYHIEDKKYGAIKKNFYNKQGFCNKHLDTNAKILSFGDSFTFCNQIKPEQTWIYNIFNLNDTSEIYNYGITGAGPNDYKNIIFEKVNQKTELIIYAIYEGNDLLNLWTFNNLISNTSPNKSNDIKSNKEKLIFIKKIFGNSYVFNFFWSYTKLKFFSYTNEKINFKYKRKNNLNIIDFNIGNSDTDEVDSAIFYVKEKEKKFNKDFAKDKLTEIFLNVKNFSNKNNSKILFIYIPSAYSAFGYENTIFEDKDIKKLVFNYSSLFQKFFEEICFENKLDCINLTSKFIDYNLRKNIPSHFPYNLHLTPAGNLVISKSIKRYICGENLEKSDYLREKC